MKTSFVPLAGVVFATVLSVTGCTLSPTSIAPSIEPNDQYKQSLEDHDKHPKLHSIQVGDDNGEVSLFADYFIPLWGPSVERMQIKVAPTTLEGEVMMDDRSGKAVTWLDIQGPLLSGFDTLDLFSQPSEFSNVWHNANIQCVLVLEADIFYKQKDGRIRTEHLNGEKIREFTPKDTYCKGDLL